VDSSKFSFLKGPIMQQQKQTLTTATRNRVLRGLGLALVFCASATLVRADIPDVPELAVGSLVGALTLLTGGVLVFAGRRRR